MKIAFKSYIREESWSSSIIQIIATMSRILYDQESIILQTKSVKNQYGIPIPKREQCSRVEQLKLGMDKISKSMVAGTCSKELFIEYSRLLQDKSFDYFIKEQPIYLKDYVSEQDKIILDMITLAELCYKNVYIDCGIGQNACSRTILKEADLIFINLNLEEKNLSDLMLQYDFTNPNICLLIENEDDKKKKLSNHIFYTYPFLNANNTFFIPNNREFKVANSDSKTKSLIYQNIYCEPEDENYRFIEGIKNTVYKINEMSAEGASNNEQKCFKNLPINEKIEVS